MRHSLLFLAATCGLACSGQDTQTPRLDLATQPADWVLDVVQQPSLFEALVEETSREGWIALHDSRFAAAAAAFEGDAAPTRRARSRAEWSQALFYEDLARAAARTHEALFTEWDERKIPRSEGIEVLAILGARCPGFEIAGQAADEAEVPPLVTERRELLRTVAAGSSPDDLLRAASKPLLSESSDDFERAIYDPCVYAALAAHWRGRGASSAGGTEWRQTAASWTGEAGLEATLFAPWLSTADLEAELAVATHAGTVGATMPSNARLGIDEPTATDDDLERARTEVRTLDEALETRRATLLDGADEAGIELLVHLKLQERFRQEWLVVRARKALLEGRPHQALAILELARDVRVREVGVDNIPSVLALQAEARITLGHTRDALEALQVLAERFPEVIGLRELSGDLAVLQGLDRHGDSKEN